MGSFFFLRYRILKNMGNTWSVNSNNKCPRHTSTSLAPNYYTIGMPCTMSNRYCMVTLSNQPHQGHETIVHFLTWTHHSNSVPPTSYLKVNTAMPVEILDEDRIRKVEKWKELFLVSRVVSLTFANSDTQLSVLWFIKRLLMCV